MDSGNFAWLTQWDKDGDILLSARYKNGLIHGNCSSQWEKSGRTAFLGFYSQNESEAFTQQNGSPIKTWHCEENGVGRDGRWEFFYPNGDLFMEGNYMCGISISFNDEHWVVFLSDNIEKIIPCETTSRNGYERSDIICESKIKDYLRKISGKNIFHKKVEADWFIFPQDSLSHVTIFDE